MLSTPTSPTPPRHLLSRHLGGIEVANAISAVVMAVVAVFTAIHDKSLQVLPFATLALSLCLSLGAILYARRYYRQEAERLIEAHQREALDVIDTYRQQDAKKFEALDANSQKHFDHINENAQKSIEAIQLQSEQRIAAAEAKIVKQRDLENIKLEEFMERNHAFFHQARFSLLRILANYSSMLGAFSLDPKARQSMSTFFMHKAILEEMSGLVGMIPRIFETLIGPQASLWAAIREDEDGQFHTRFRTGQHSVHRAENSQPFSANEGIAKLIRWQIANQSDCVVILNRSRYTQAYIQSPNDKFGEDRSVIAGPIHIYHPSRTDHPQREMAMLLYLNSPQDDIFNAVHKATFKCLIDTLSMVLSTAYLMLDYDFRNPPQEPDQEEQEPDHG